MYIDFPRTSYLILFSIRGQNYFGKSSRDGVDRLSGTNNNIKIDNSGTYLSKNCWFDSRSLLYTLFYVVLYWPPGAKLKRPQVTTLSGKYEFANEKEYISELRKYIACSRQAIDLSKGCTSSTWYWLLATKRKQSAGMVSDHNKPVSLAGAVGIHAKNVEASNSDEQIVV